MKKRVWSLCRVSTEKQSESLDDIPLQRNAIEKFIKLHDDWILDREFVEVDVSGYKLKSSERSELVLIQEGAKNKDFEVFLVFMFDRIGRRWDDSPQVVEGIVTSGVEVWSVKEGQQKFDNHVDRLINFITFWQAGGESLKTSMRVKEQMEQLNEVGRFMGGSAPYGYEMYDSGIFKKDKNGKKIKELKFLRVNKEEESLVKLVYDLSINKGFGSNRIAKYLNLNHYLLREGGKWKANYITRILNNPIYKGYKRYNQKSELQPFNPEYVIIPEEIWDQSQQVSKQRKVSSKIGNDHPFPRKSELLFSGLVCCGYCGSKLLTDYSVKTYKKKDGSLTKNTAIRYYCNHRKNSSSDFEHEITQFGAKKYETNAKEELENQISQIDFAIIDNLIEKNIRHDIQEKKIEIEKRERLLNYKETELKGLESLRIKVELGQSKLSPEYIEGMMLDHQKGLIDFKRSMDSLKQEVIQDEEKLKNSSELKDLLSNWDEIYNRVDWDTKKIILSKIIKHISFRKDEIKLVLVLE